MDFKVNPRVNGVDIANEGRANVFTERQTVRTNDRLSFRSGSGVPLGPPPDGPQVSSAGAGPLSGTYSYAYMEGDTEGQTPLSPAATISVSGESVQIEVPPGRPGTVGRKLFRTRSGGSEFFLLVDFQSGDGYFQQTFVDDVPDDSLGAPPPTADTTSHYDFVVFDTVKYFRQHPDTPAPHDLTMINGDPRVASGWCIDAYGSIVARQKLGHNFISFHTGDQGAQITANWNDDKFPNPMVNVFEVEARGRVNVRPTVQGNALYVAPRTPTTKLGEATLYVEPAAGTTQPAAWITSKGTNGGSDGLMVEQLDAGATAACIKLKNAGTGPLIASSTSRFKVSAQGDMVANSLEIRTPDNTLLQRLAPNGSTNWHNSTGVLKGSFDNSNGYLRGSGLTNLANTGAYVDTGSDRLQIIQRNPGATTLRLIAANGQTGNILETATSTGAVGMAVDSNRRLKWFSGAEQTTVGPNGSASSPPNRPAKYLAVTDSTGQTLLIPAYRA